MYVAFSSLNSKSTMSFITGGDAAKLESWLVGKPPNRVEMGMIPTVAMSGTLPVVDVLPTWVRGTIVLNRPEQTASTSSQFVSIQPPTMKIRLLDKPTYTLSQFFPNGTPYLAYKEMSTPSPYYTSDITVVKLGNVQDLMGMSPNRRVVYQPNSTQPNTDNLPMPVPVTSASNPRSVSYLPTAAAIANHGVHQRTANTVNQLPTVRANTPPRQPINTKMLRFSPTLPDNTSTFTCPGTGQFAPRRRRASEPAICIDLTGPDDDDTLQSNRGNDTIELSSDDSHRDDNDNTRRTPTTPKSKSPRSILASRHKKVATPTKTPQDNKTQAKLKINNFTLKVVPVAKRRRSNETTPTRPTNPDKPTDTEEDSDNDFVEEGGEERPAKRGRPHKH